MFTAILFFFFLLVIFGVAYFFTSKLLLKKGAPSTPKTQSPLGSKILNFLVDILNYFDKRKYNKAKKSEQSSDTEITGSAGNIRYCPYCDSKVPKNATKCWNCKNRLPVSKSNIIASIILGFVSIFIIAFALSSLVSQPSTPAPTISKSEYISRCNTISYESLARNPDSHKGDYFTFTGEVIQVLEQGSYVNLRVNVTAETLFESTYYSDTIYVVTTLPDDGDRILEGDIITLYGVCDGLYTYTTVLGSTLSIPKIDAAYWDIQ